MLRRRIADALIVGALLPFALGTLLPAEPPDAPVSPWCAFCGYTGAVDFVLNVLVLAPLGLGLALRQVHARRAIVAVIALTVCVELAQAFVVPGRHASARDVVANAVGGTLGFALGAAYPRLLAPSPRLAARLALATATCWLGLQAFGAASLRPTFSDEEHFGQPQYEHAQWPPFTGRLLSARVMGEVLPNGDFDDWRAFRARLVRGPVTVDARVLPGPPQREYSPFARVVASSRESLALAQRGDAVVFSVRTLAADLGFRPTRFLLRHAFPDGDVPGDTLDIHASYDGATAHLVARRGAVTLERRIRMSASAAWTLPLPASLQGYIGTGILRIGTGVYLLGILIPFAYWTRAAGAAGATAHGGTRRAAAALLLIAVPVAGLLVVPVSLGVYASPLEEWIAALAAVGLGLRLRGRVGRREPANGRPGSCPAAVRAG